MSDLLPKRGPGRPPNNPPAAAPVPVSLPRGYISRDGYRAKYGADDYAEVPEASWGLCEFPDTMSPRELSRIRGKRGL